MSTKLFVGNFSFSIDDEKLKNHFSQLGTVISAKVMKEGQGGRSRGFGFVEMASADEAQNAIAKLDGTVWEGRVIKVSEDRSNRRDRDDRDGPREHGGGGGGERHGGGGDDGGHRGAPSGYFKAQPLELSFRRKRKIDPFMEDPKLKIDYKDPRLLTRFLSERGRILPRRMTGLSAHNQRQITRAIKRAQHLGLLAITRG